MRRNDDARLRAMRQLVGLTCGIDACTDLPCQPVSDAVKTLYLSA